MSNIVYVYRVHCYDALADQDGPSPTYRTREEIEHCGLSIDESSALAVDANQLHSGRYAPPAPRVAYAAWQGFPGLKRWFS